MSSVEQFKYDIYMKKPVFPVDMEEKERTLDKPLVICIAPTGAFIMRNQNPNQPYVPKEVASEAIECIQAGAAVFHVHLRHSNGMPDYTPEGIRQTCDLVFDKCPDVITTTAAWGDPTKQGAEVRKPVFDPLVRQGMKYCQMTVMTPVSMAIGPQNVRAAEDTMQDEVRYYNSLGIKPEFMAHNEEAIENVKRWLMNQDLLQKPYVIYASMGMHHSTPGVPGPWSSLHLLSMLHYMPPNTFVGVSIGGRNWLPLTVQAITWGVDYVRIGMEDTCWLYPHLDEMIRKNVQVVSKIVNIAKELGREIATPDKARELMGLKKP